MPGRRGTRQDNAGTARDTAGLVLGSAQLSGWTHTPDEPGRLEGGTVLSAATTSARTTRGLSAPLLVGGAFVLSTVVNILFHVGEILFTNHDPHAPGGSIESIESVAIVGGIGLVVALAVALPLAKNAAKARVGAIVLGVLALVFLPVFWSGAPAVLGASAAWLAGLTKGGQPQSGAARAFGIIGFVIAVLEVVATFAGPVADALI